MLVTRYAISSQTRADAIAAQVAGLIDRRVEIDATNAELISKLAGANSTKELVKQEKSKLEGRLSQFKESSNARPHDCEARSTAPAAMPSTLYLARRCLRHHLSQYLMATAAMPSTLDLTH